VVWTENPPKGATAEFKFAGDYYDVSFSGQFTGTITITMPYDPRWPDAKALNFKLQHLVDGEWVDVPVTVDLENHTITAVVDSLSPFALALPPGVDLSTSLLVRRPAAVPQGRPVVLSARLLDASSTPLPERVVVLQRLVEGTWTVVATATPAPGAPGSYRATDTPAPSGITRYRFVFDGAPGLDPCVSAEIRVATTASILGRVSPGRGRAAFVVRIAPAHGTVTLTVQRKVGGSYRTVQRKALRTPGGTARTSFTLKPGVYRYRVSHKDASHAGSVTGWRTFRVR
jgi:hypothetical protein